MYFYYAKDIPFSSLETSPVILTLSLAKGYAQFIDVGIPKGTQRLAKIRLFYNEFQLLPFNRDEWLTGEDITLRIPLEIFLDTPPYDFLIKCINLDDTFLHQISFGVSVDIGKTVNASAIDTLNQFVMKEEG